jgi:hypothetical protein
MSPYGGALPHFLQKSFLKIVFFSVFLLIYLLRVHSILVCPCLALKPTCFLRIHHLLFVFFDIFPYFSLTL